MLELKNIYKSFNNEDKQLQVLNDVSFKFNRSEITAILGPSGCGKTTLLRIISGLINPDSGKIKKESCHNFKMPIIWQDNRLFPWQTVEQNIGFGLEGNNLGKKLREKRIKEYLGLMKLNQFKNYYPSQLSGGMQARVAIARAMIVEPDILLMDEPFASIDYQTKIRLFKEIKKTQKQKQLPIIYVTHDTRDAIAFADQVIVLSSRPAKVKKVIDTKGVDVLSMDLEKEIWELLKN